jgi:hypothetical protein
MDLMVTENYKRALATAKSDYDKLLKERERIDAQLIETRDVILSLSKMCERESDRVVLPPDVQAASDPRLAKLQIYGLTDAVRIMLQSSIGLTTATEIRDRLLFYGYDLSRYSNQMAAIHGVLVRLLQAKAVAMEESDGKTWYRWALPPGAVPINTSAETWTKKSSRASR